ncbi:hypothetical protein GCM10007876_12870 [Litoribrevibacter albus]|uniref:Uncharacterized protein n=2 Tax=Litoribrevibacter albus TaxID=1473156 RepID=A0AA37W711_9GAMM|nr:hypothetical protein GCM10007876_12870 [Litoribrevibacter albus]
MSRRSELSEVTREQINTSERTTSTDGAALTGTGTRTGRVIGISQDTRVEYDQTYKQYSYRNSDVYSFNELMHAGAMAEATTSFTDTSFIEQTLSVVFSGQRAARFLIQPNTQNIQGMSGVDRSINVSSTDGGPVNVNGVSVTPRNDQSSFGEFGPSGSRVLTGNSIPVSGTGLMQIKQYTQSQIDQTQLFNGHGTVTTADGRVINFGLYLAMDRQERVATQSELLVQSRPMTDPLVINFGAETARLEDRFFDFDIDGDGVSEQIGTLAKGSGYLVFDRNHNGKVDDGTELFGSQSGSGFGELAQYDSDGNLWLDEGDPIFHELQVWVTSETGEESLMSLSEVGVGAIYLGSADADFDLVSPEGLALGRVKTNGVYLTEEGEVRSVQEIDLANQSQPQSETPVVMTTAAMEDQVEQARLMIPGQTEDESDSESTKVVIPDMSMAIQRLEQLRDDQKAFALSFKDDDNPSVLSRLVEALEETLKLNREKLNQEKLDL